MLRLIPALALAAALLPVGPAVAQQSGGRSGSKEAMKATAPMKMTPPGEGDAMRECDRMAMQQHIKMEDHARFVQDCIARKMAGEKK